MHTTTWERQRITLEIRAVVEPYRDHQVQNDPTVRAGYRRRAWTVLKRLDGAALPLDLQASLLAARVELGLPESRWQATRS